MGESLASAGLGERGKFTGKQGNQPPVLGSQGSGQSYLSHRLKKALFW